MSNSHPTIPARDEIAENETAIRLNNGHTQLDDNGRIAFTAFWRQDGTPAGVRGQVFHTNLRYFIARHAERGEVVRGLDAATRELLASLS